MSSSDLTLEEGLSIRLIYTVAENDTARYCQSGRSDILATPALVRYMEAAAQKIVDGGIPFDWQSIGTFISVEHGSATPAGFEVEVKATLVRISNKNLSFEISAFDKSGQIAKAIHKRILTKTATLDRLLSKKKK